MPDNIDDAYCFTGLTTMMLSQIVGQTTKPRLISSATNAKQNGCQRLGINSSLLLHRSFLAL